MLPVSVNQVFNFQDVIVDIREENGILFFRASDIASILEHSNATVMLQIVRDSETKNFLVPNCRNEIRETPYLNEQGLYRVLFRSNSHKAEPFQDWLANEVLPSIRKYGKYEVKAKTPPSFLEYYKKMREDWQYYDIVDTELFKYALTWYKWYYRIDFTCKYKATKNIESMFNKFNKQLQIEDDEQREKNKINTALNHVFNKLGNEFHTSNFYANSKVLYKIKRQEYKKYVDTITTFLQGKAIKVTDAKWRKL